MDGQNGNGTGHGYDPRGPITNPEGVDFAGLEPVAEDDLASVLAEDTDELLTPARLRERKAAEDARYFKFTLEETGGYIIVQRANLAALATVRALPKHVQAIIANHFNTGVKIGQNGGKRPDGLKGLYQGLARSDDLARAYCVACSVYPQIVFSEDDITDPEKQIASTDIEPGDRQALMSIMEGNQAAEARRLERFPAGQLRNLVGERNGQTVSESREPVSISGIR